MVKSRMGPHALGGSGLAGSEFTVAGPVGDLIVVGSPGGPIL